MSGIVWLVVSVTCWAGLSIVRAGVPWIERYGIAGIVAGGLVFAIEVICALVSLALAFQTLPG